ncbi:MAG: von Willebrand factor type A domain-containing protein [Clostridiales bacterium]|nr:von Willebrand factor type A domain-containing protein [Clostridiales bacterium]
MKIKKILTAICALSLAASTLTACGAGDYNDGVATEPGNSWSGSPVVRPNIPDGMIIPDTGELENYQTENVTERSFVSAAITPDSYFSLDRNTASYSYMRRIISDGKKVASGSVRLEEYINYFSYDYARPTDGEALAVSGNLFDCPWNTEHKLMSIGVAAEEVTYGEKPNNIVFLIDTSGSMYGEDRLGLIQQSFSMIVENLDDNDTVSIVTYAGDSRVALSGESGKNKTKICNVLQDLEAMGSTNGQGGIQKAYSLAQQYYSAEANNRVILATDGDFNVGASSKDALKSLITQKRESGIYLSVLGVGMYNTNDITMKTLAENGNGNYAYLDSVAEARKVLIEELGGTFNVVAKDAKMGVTFNDKVVDKYRLLGYESKMMSQEEFDDDKKDAGELGSGHTVTALYEVELKDNADGAVATCEVRYKTPDTEENKSVSRTLAISDYAESPNEDTIFIGCVAEYALVLRESRYKGDASLSNVIERLSALDCTKEGGDQFKSEFLEVVKKAKQVYGAV